MDKKNLEKEVIQFRDGLKEYQVVVREIWDGKRTYSSAEKIEGLIKEKEVPLREKLIEDFGKLEKYLIKVGIDMVGIMYGREFPIFDSALDAKLFDNPVKAEALSMAIQMTIKSVGIIKSLDDKDFEKLEKRTPVVFVSYNFDEKNKDIVNKFIDFLSKFDIAISLGSEVDTKSISEKVKTKIDDADIIIAIMTKDEQDEKGNWSPSKWIIEELAYALAHKNKEIVRLLEQGCITNGRIFGDREYIPFNRENPTEVIIRLTEVLNKRIN